MEGKTQRLNKDQKVFVVKTFYENSNKSGKCRLFEGKFQRNIKRDTVSILIQRFEDTGLTDDLPKPGRSVTACSPENREINQGPFSLSPTKSTRRASMELNISRTSIRRLHTVNIYKLNKYLIYIKKLHFWYCPLTSGPSRIACLVNPLSRVA